jgi:hypothetical protein
MLPTLTETADEKSWLVWAAGLCAVAPSVFLALRLLFIDSSPGSVALPILAAPCIVALLTYGWPHRLSLLILADIVLFLVFMLLLLGLAGLLYLPALGLMLAATGREIGLR